jgi:hypothetical protein
MAWSTVRDSTIAVKRWRAVGLVFIVAVMVSV